MSIDTYRDSKGEIYRSQYEARQALQADLGLRMFKHSLSMRGTEITDVTEAFLHTSTRAQEAR